MEEKLLRDTFGDYLVKVGKINADLVVLDADLSTSTRTNKFANEFPHRFFNMGIAEQNMVGVALGFAISGKIPVVSGFSIFTTGRAWEFIRLASHDNLNIKFVTTHGGIVGEDGSTHHALEDFSLMSVLPNLNVLVPADNIELSEILDYALKSHGPFYIRLPRGSFPKIHNKDYNFTLGKPDILKEGNDICLIAAGYGNFLALESISKIEKELNISAKVINLPSIKPIDKEALIKEVNNMKAVIVIEEHNVYCGFGSIIARIITEAYPIKIKCIGVENSFGSSGNREDLLNFFNLNTEKIIEEIKLILNLNLKKL
ncbi:MAG: transketolase C-terminal domain-containing protein [Promethearchaeia archaeon]